MDAELQTELASHFGSEVVSVRPLSGGDINDVYAVRLASGERACVKTNRASPQGMFQAEARGLEWLREAQAIRIPRVIAVAAPLAKCQFLALELVEAAPRRADFDELLGRSLAGLHRAAPSTFGFASDNYIGSLPQGNETLPSWAEFYAERRLAPQIRRAVDAGRLPVATQKSLEGAIARLPVMVGAPEPPARLHGDLWGGNLHVDEHGQPCLIDPAVYGGHREVDLAMMRLFGGFSERVFSAYSEAFPLSAEASERVSLYQLYPLLVHVNLFGGGYVGSLEAALARWK